MTTTPQPQVDIEELEALAKAATPWPWHREMIELGNGGPLTLGIGGPTAPVCIVNGIVESPRGNRDVNAIIAMRNSIDALIAETRALRAVKQELADWKAMMRRFVPSNREPARCRNCERLFIDHYGGPFAEPDTAYCSKYAVPTAPLPAPPEAP